MTGKKKDDVEVGEQMDLIDVHPKKAKPIIAAAKILKKFQIARSSAQQKENDQKDRVLDHIHAAKITRLDNGKIRFHYDDITITVTPKSESISIKE
jgi:hypothetical protein